jgi:flavin reductase (DIM6/NTAB) family NADH-FMN oxidoreductase RutF
MVERISSADYREILAHFASGVVVVAARGATGPVGLTATAFASVSLVPPLVLVCIDKEASLHGDITAATSFGVSFLAAGQVDVARRFAQSDVDRFEGVALRSSRTHVPLIDGALAYLECRRHALHEVGDHSIVVGEVAHGSLNREAGRHPLVHFGRAFGGFVA